MKRLFESASGRRFEVVLQPGGVVAVHGEGGVQLTTATARQAPGGVWLVEVDGIARPVRLSRVGDVAWVSQASTRDFPSQTGRFSRVEASRAGSHVADAQLRSPMMGRVVLVHVREGDAVDKGQPLVVVEAMKMEHAIKAPRAGVIARVSCVAGQQVEGGAELVALVEPPVDEFPAEGGA